MENPPKEVIEFAAYAVHQRHAAQKYVPEKYFSYLERVPAQAQATGDKPDGYEPGWVVDVHLPKQKWKAAAVQSYLQAADLRGESIAAGPASSEPAAGPATPRKSTLRSMGSALGGMIGFPSNDVAETPTPVHAREPSQSASPPSVFDDESAVDSTRSTISPSPEARKAAGAAEMSPTAASPSPETRTAVRPEKSAVEKTVPTPPAITSPDPTPPDTEVSDAKSDSSDGRSSSRDTVVPAQTQSNPTRPHQASETGLFTPRPSTTPPVRPEGLRGAVVEDDTKEADRSPTQPGDDLAKTNPVQHIKNALRAYYKSESGGDELLQAQFKAVAKHNPPAKPKLRQLYGLVRGLPGPLREGLLQQQGLNDLIKHCTDVDSLHVVKNAIHAFLKDQDGEKLAKAFQTASSMARTRQDKEDIGSLLNSVVGLPVLGYKGLKEKKTVREMASYCRDYHQATNRLQSAPPPSSPTAPALPTAPDPPLSPATTTFMEQPVGDPPDPPRTRPNISGRLEKRYPPRLAGEPEPPSPADAGVLRYEPGFDYQTWFPRCKPLDRFGLNNALIRKTATKNPHRPRCFSPYGEFESAAERWIQIPDQDMLNGTKVWAYIRDLDNRNRLIVETESLDGRSFSRAWILPTSLYAAEQKRFKAYMANTGWGMIIGSIDELKDLPRPARKNLINNVAYAPRNTERRSDTLVEVMTFSGWRWYQRSDFGKVFNQKKVDEELERVRPRPEWEN